MFYYLLLAWMLVCYATIRKPTIFSILIVILPLFLMIAFRGEYVGADTPAYYNAYASIMKGDSLREIIDESRLEVGYLTLCWGIKQIGLNNTQWIFIVEALLFCSAIIYFSLKNANDVIFVLITSSLALMEFALSGVRQTIAISIFLVAYNFAANKKLIIYTLLVYLASLFHTSVLMIYPIYFLINIKFRRETIFLYIAILLLSLLFINKLFYFFNDSLGYDYVLHSLNAGYISFVVSLIFLSIVLATYRREINNTLFMSSAHLTVLNTVFGAIRFVNVMAMRVMLYFTCFPYLMIDRIESSHNRKKQYKVIAIIYISLYIIYRTFFIENYYFCWNS